MKILHLCTSLLLLFTVTTGAPDTIVVGSYNCEAFFDLHHDNTEFPAYSEESWNITSFRTKVDNLASVISALGADILTLNEIESSQALKELQKALSKRQTPYKYAFIPPKASRQGFAVALLSVYPILEAKTEKVMLPNKRVSRDILQTDLLIRGDTLTIISCHWPSKLNPESYRIAAAKVVRRMVDALPKNRAIIIAGDLNSNHDEATSLLGARCGDGPCDDKNGMTGINHTLKTYTSPPGKAPKNFLPTDTVRGFFNPWSELASARDWSYIHENHRLTIDHLLLSSHFFKKGRFSYLAHSFTSFDHKGKLLMEGLPYRWQIARGDVPQHLNQGYSDHLPVKLTILHNGPQTKSVFSPITGSFEQARDGWFSASKEVEVYITDSLATEGKRALIVTGTPAKNTSVTTLTYLQKGDQKGVSFFVRGVGALCLRVKTSTQKKWRYFSNTGTPQSVASYPKKRWSTWTLLQLSNIAQPGDTVTVQLRSKGGEKIHLLIDHVSQNGWAR